MTRILIILFFTVYNIVAFEYNSIEIKGNKAFFTKTLLDVAGVDVRSGLIGFKKDLNISIDNVNEIRDSLVEFYNSKGYYKCEVVYETQGPKVVFYIEELSPIKISSIKINSDAKLKRFITLEKDDIFDSDKFVEMKNMIRRHLDESGYPKAKLNSQAEIYIDPYEANVELNVTNYRRSKIAHIELPNIPRISKDAIKKKLTFTEGNYYDIRELEKSRENLYLTDLFSAVKIELAEATNTEVGDDVTIVVTLEKAKEKSIKASIGYSTDEGPRMKFSWIDKNTFGDFKRVETSLNLMSDSQSADAILFMPELFGHPFENRVAFEQNRYSYLGYSDKQLSNTFKFVKDSENAKQYFGLKTERGAVQTASDSEFIRNQNYVTNALLYEYLRDKRDSKLDATRGYFVDMNVEFANNIFASTLNYVKTEIEGRTIYTFPYTSSLSDLTIALKGLAGSVDDLRQSYIPIFKRFFAGGSFSNRGYQYQRMGPTDGSGNFIGAKTIVDASAEARYKLTQKTAVVLFYDTTLLDYDSMSLRSKFKPSLGLGLRYDTGVGPIRFDVGVPLAEEKRSPAFHISFGQMF